MLSRCLDHNTILQVTYYKYKVSVLQDIMISVYYGLMVLWSVCYGSMLPHWCGKVVLPDFLSQLHGAVTVERVFAP